MINRRDFLGIGIGAGAALAITPEFLRALRPSRGELIQRAIPSSGELVPSVGLSFSNHPGCADPAALREVLRTFADNGARVFDAMHGNASAEQFHATVANELGIHNKLFWSTRGTPPDTAPQAGAAFVNSHIDTLLQRIRMPSIDLVMLPATTHPSHLAALKEEKLAGRVRYIGVQVITSAVYPELEAVMRNEPIDFIGVPYDISDRSAENTVLPLARERRIGVMAFFPFGNAGGSSCAGGTGLFSRVANRPLPGWAADFDAATWAQFFLKYVLSEPAVTVARVGTTKAAHMLDNIGGGIGRLPDEATRKRMTALIDALPLAASLTRAAPWALARVVLPVALLDRYVGDYRTAAGTMMTVRRYGTRLVVKPGSNPETVIYARSETVFSSPNGLVIEFRPDSAGSGFDLIMEQGNQRLPASRIR